jgi:branched-subunit amino acid ABC-type transport system permease component
MLVSSILVNSVVWAAELGLIAIGMSLVFGILGFANFAHAEFVTIGAYITYAIHVNMGLPLLLSIAIAMLITGIFAILLDLSIFSRIRRASPVSKMVVSVGIALCIRSVIAILFGTSALSIGFSATRNPSILGLEFTNLQIIIIITALVSMVGFHFVFQKTKLGKALRATANNPDLAESRGINTTYIIRWMWFISGTFAAMGGILIGLETQLRPALGLFVLMPMFAAATVGGLGNAYGAVAGSLVLALAQNIALSVDFGSLLGRSSFIIRAGYKDAISLTVLGITLLVKPEGIAGKRGK